MPASRKALPKAEPQSNPKPQPKSQPKSQLKSQPKSEVPNLDCRYGKIGISAVAAAMRYQSEPKNTAYAPAVPRAENWRSEGMAA
jgi:hypothetical protein